MVFNATFNNISATNVYCGGQFYCWRKPEYPEKTTDLLQVTLSHNVVMSTLCLSEIRTHNFSSDGH